jgi:serine O-acetyltransferase
VSLVDSLRRDAEANQVPLIPLRARARRNPHAAIYIFQANLRMLERTLARPPSAGRRLALMILWRRHHRLGVRLGFDIPPGVFGPGLAIAHYGSIVVSVAARVGADCRIHPGTVLANSESGAPRIGDRPFLGPGCKVIGGVCLGDEVVVGANAVMIRSFPERRAVLVGVPARQIHRAVPMAALDLTSQPDSGIIKPPRSTTAGPHRAILSDARRASATGVERRLVHLYRNRAYVTAAPGQNLG